MHGSWGNLITAEEAFERMGADVMRWQYCAQPPNAEHALRVRPGGRGQAQAADALELGPVLRRLRGRSRASSRATPICRTASPASSCRPLDRWLLARTQPAHRRGDRGATTRYLTVGVIDAFEAFLEDLSNWYIRRSRRRFYGYDEAAFRTLWTALVQAAPRGRARACRSSADQLWRTLVAAPCAEAPASVHLPAGPTPSERPATRSCWRRSPRCARVVELGRQRARRGEPEAAPAAAPARTSSGATAAAGARRRDRRGAAGQGGRLRRGPGRPGCSCCRNLPAARAAPGQAAAARCARRCRTATSRSSATGGFRAAGDRARPRRGAARRADGRSRAGRSPRTTGSAWRSTRRWTTSCAARAACSTSSTPSTPCARSAGLELTDRIVVTLPQAEEDLLAYEERIAGEVLAREIRLGDALEITRA